MKKLQDLLGPQATTPMNYKSAIAKAKRILTRAGFPWGRIEGRYTPFDNQQRVVPGIFVSRVGCSGTIALAWRGERPPGPVRAERVAIDVLRAANMPFDDRGFLACENDP